MGAGKEEDEGGLTPTEDDDVASVDFSCWQACCPLPAEGIIPLKTKNATLSQKIYSFWLL